MFFIKSLSHIDSIIFKGALFTFILITFLLVVQGTAYASVTYSAPVSYEVVGGPVSVATSDLDGDGDLDIATANLDTDTISILLNDLGSFSPEVTYTFGLINPSVILSEDIESDGDNDLVVLSRGSGALGSTGTIAILSNGGDGTFTSSYVMNVQSSVKAMISSDLDGDDDVDILTGAENGSVALLLNGGDGIFSLQNLFSTGQPTVSLTSGDFDSDSDNDIALALEGFGIQIYSNNGLASFTLEQTITDPSRRVWRVYSSDIDLDSDIDILTTSKDGINNISIYKNNNLSFSLQSSLSFGLDPTSGLFADIDNDSDMDFIVLNQRSKNISILTNNSGVLTTDSLIETSAFGPLAVAKGDFNSDGGDDLVVTDRNNSQSRVLVLEQEQNNSSPVLDPIGNQTVAEGVQLEFTVSATDPDSNTLTYAAANLPAGATFNPITRTFSWTPGYSDAGNYTDVEFSVSDDGIPMELDVELIIITVGDVNRAPELTNPGPQETLENMPLSFNISATDPDNDTVSIIATNMPTGATFDGSIFAWTPTFVQEGIYTITFTATDNGVPNESSLLGVVISVGDNPTPTEQAEDLVDAVITLDISQNVENSYLANLQKVEQFINEGKIQAALNQLNAFINKVTQDYQQGVLSSTERDNFVVAAEKLISDLTQ